MLHHVHVFPRALSDWLSCWKNPDCAYLEDLLSMEQQTHFCLEFEVAHAQGFPLAINVASCAAGCPEHSDVSLLWFSVRMKVSVAAIWRQIWTSPVHAHTQISGMLALGTFTSVPAIPVENHVFLWSDQNCIRAKLFEVIFNLQNWLVCQLLRKVCECEGVGQIARQSLQRRCAWVDPVSCQRCPLRKRRASCLRWLRSCRAERGEWLMMKRCFWCAMEQTTPNITSMIDLYRLEPHMRAWLTSAQACVPDTTRLRTMCVRRRVVFKVCWAFQWCVLQALFARIPRSSGFLRTLQFYTVDQVLRLSFSSALSTTAFVVCWARNSRSLSSAVDLWLSASQAFSIKWFSSAIDAQTWESVSCTKSRQSESLRYSSRKNNWSRILSTSKVHLILSFQHNHKFRKRYRSRWLNWWDPSSSFKIDHWRWRAFSTGLIRFSLLEIVKSFQDYALLHKIHFRNLLCQFIPLSFWIIWIFFSKFRT